MCPLKTCYIFCANAKQLNPAIDSCQNSCVPQNPSCGIIVVSLSTITKLKAMCHIVGDVRDGLQSEEDMPRKQFPHPVSFKNHKQFPTDLQDDMADGSPHRQSLVSLGCQEACHDYSSQSSLFALVSATCALEAGHVEAHYVQ